MSKVLELEDQLRQAGEAEMILGHHLVRNALDTLRADAYAKIEGTKPSQKDEREYLYLFLKAIAAFESQFQFHIDEGRIASSFIDKMRAEKAAKRRRS